MAFRIEWSRSAQRDLNEITRFIAHDSIAQALLVLESFDRAVQRLSLHPRSGRIVPEVGRHDIREVYSYNYRVVYLVQPEAVIVVAVLHGMRLLDRNEIERREDD